MKITAKTPSTLAELLMAEFATASKTTVKSRIAHGNVKVNGKTVTNPAFLLKEGDEVWYERQAAPVSKIKPPHQVLYEDASIVVALKPAGLLTIGDRGTGGTSFYQQMLDWVKEKSGNRERILVVHRIDREVSGLLVLAKTEEVQEYLKKNWEETKKHYFALVEGTPPKEQGTIRSWLAEGRDQKVFSTRNKEGAKLAVTHYRVMDKSAGYTLLEVELETGRKNQIRVHLSEMGCPVVGDRRYGADATFQRRIRLHAHYLAFRHPETEAVMEFKSKMPRGFLVLKEENEKYK